MPIDPKELAPSSSSSSSGSGQDEHFGHEGFFLTEESTESNTGSQEEDPVLSSLLRTVDRASRSSLLSGGGYSYSTSEEENDIASDFGFSGSRDEASYGDQNQARGEVALTDPTAETEIEEKGPAPQDPYAGDFLTHPSSGPDDLGPLHVPPPPSPEVLFAPEAQSPADVSQPPNTYVTALSAMQASIQLTYNALGPPKEEKSSSSESSSP